ncbi:MAG: glycoside hydrolase, partial [candidate division KSB1 bacterium]|nr:glycoside hydrolase [candidate division KSB1 bacterium]
MNFQFRVAKAYVLLSPLFLIGILISFQIRSEAQERTKRLNFVPVSGAAALTKGLPEHSQITSPSISQSFSLAKSLTVTNWLNIPVIVIQRPQNETSIVVSPADPLNSVGVWNDYQQTVGNNIKNVHAGYGYSINGGASWQRGLITSPYQSQFDPSVTSDKNGNFYYCFAAQDTGGWFDLPGGIFVAKANAASKGATWGTPVVVVEHPTYPSPHFEDKPYVSVDITNSSYTGNIYVVWTRFAAVQLDTSRILFTKSINGGTSFSQSFIELDLEYWKHPEFGPFDYVLGAMPAVGPNGEIYVAWTKFDPDRPDDVTKNFIRFKKSTNGGSSFGSLVNVAGIKAVRKIKGNLEAPSFPSMAVDRNNGYIYIVWSAKSNSGDLDIYLSKSTNGGTSWSASPIRVNQDPSGNGKDQFLPWISVDPTGRISVIYYDQRNYP